MSAAKCDKRGFHGKTSPNAPKCSWCGGRMLLVMDASFQYWWVCRNKNDFAARIRAQDGGQKVTEEPLGTTAKPLRNA